MILQSLSEYYKQRVALGSSNYAPQGMELKRIHFVLVVGLSGELVDVEQLDAKVCVIKSRSRCGKDAVLVSNLMWDSVGYVVGYGATDKLKTSATIQHSSFVEKVRELHQLYPMNRTFAAVARFYSHYFDQLTSHSSWKLITAKTGHNLTFRLAHETTLAAQQEELLQCTSSGTHSKCMITGDKSPIALLHPKMYIHGGAPTGTKLISFTKRCGYDSYYKQGGENAPISIKIAENYSAALTGLLQNDSDNCVVVSNVTFLFFVAQSSKFDSLFRALIDPSIKIERSKIIGKIYNYIYSKESETEFVLMAMVPNAARVSIRLYLRTTIGEISKNIISFYEEIDLQNNFNTPKEMALLLPLFISAPQGNINKLPSQTIVDYMLSIATRTRFPVVLQNELLNKQRKLKSIDIGVVALLRLYLNRTTNQKNNIPMALDKENRNTGYLLGRLFAILERTQEISNPGITFTLKDTYYTMASVNPSAVFNRLISLSNSFFRRITKQGTAIYLKSQLGEVTELLHGIPMRLSLDDQSRFALGYFHQRQIYFIKKEPSDTTT